ncbi:ABC transporter substrate-binding protein [Pelagibacterium montanilacus]|uniref:ABC transporter substrate-binding protein n=1 Tax=Pelagibacterium montanilacus TaxID=2185280 RepID=UPI000F8DE71F|nr:extracellular solute-binding protein [Pelagibacterium montanilacus]
MTVKFQEGRRRHLLRATTALSGLLAAAVVAGSLGVSAVSAQESFEAITDENVYFRGWQFRTDVVQGNVDTYNETMGGNVDYATVTGDYPAIMEQNLIAGGELDVLYANPSSAVRYFEGGWITPATALPNSDEIMEDMYPNIREAWTHNGELLGLSYFVSVRGTLLANLELIEEAGFTEEDLPATWPELYDMVYALNEAGVDTPFLPHWFAEYFGISWGFVFEVMNRGGVVADAETNEPMLSVDGPAGETLADWKELWNSGLVPEEVLSYNEAAFIDAYRSGRYVFSPQQLYDIKTFNDESQSADVAGHITLLSSEEQSWGLIDSAMYMMTSRDRAEDHTQDVMNFTSWYGYKNEEGEYAVANRWLEENMLFSAYRSVMESDMAREAIESAVARPEDYQTLLDVYATTDYPAGIWNVVWAEEFNSWLRDKLFAFLQNDLPVEEVINEANAEIERLNDRYGL